MDAGRDGGEPNGYQGSSHLHPGASGISPPSRQRKLKVGVTTQSRPKRGSFCKCTFYYL